jgi:hypothetical protein
MGLGNPWTLGMWPAACQVRFAKSGGLLELLELLEHSGTFWNFWNFWNFLEPHRSSGTSGTFWNFLEFACLGGPALIRTWALKLHVCDF